jgi:hypothetical protein
MPASRIAFERSMSGWKLRMVKGAMLVMSGEIEEIGVINWVSF